MEKKKVKDTTKEDHYVEIAVGFKIIYNQNQYLAYTEVPKKKKDIRLEIYIGRVSLLKDQYLLFKCETDSERRQVFSYFKQVFSGEPSNEIEPVDFSAIERMSIVSSDLFDEKMDQYPNFFTLPKKEEIDANITLPSFLMKKSSRIEKQPDEIQFVGNSDEVLETNVETPAISTETVTPDEEIVPVPIPAPEVSVTPNQNVTPVQPVAPNRGKTIKEQTPVISTLPEQKPIENAIPINTPPIAPVENKEVESKIEHTTTDQTPVASPVLEQNPIKSVETMSPISIPVAPVEPTVAPNSPIMPNLAVNPQTNPSQTATQNPQVAPNVTPVTPIPTSITEVATPVTNKKMEVIPPVEPALNPPVEETVKFEQIYDGPKKKKGKTSIVVLMIITLLLIASIAVVYVFVIEPKMKEQESNKPNKPPVVEPDEPKTSNLVCTLETENEEDNSLENKEITFVYDNTSKNIVSSKEHTTVTMYDTDMYMERKAMIKVFSQELKNTEGQKYTFKYDDKKFIYQVLIERNYEKATEEEKDETWKLTFDEANDYYLGEGYTCNGKKKEEPLNEKELTSMTGNDTVDYNNWIVTYQKAILSEDKETLSITLEVKNNGTETRTLNGELKLFDKDNQIIRKSKLNQQINFGETSSLTIEVKSMNETENPELGSLETIDFENITQYLVELYR